MDRRGFLKLLGGAALLPVVAQASNSMVLTSGVTEYTPKTAAELYKAMNALIPSAGYISNRAYEEDEHGKHDHVTYGIIAYDDNMEVAEERLVRVIWESFLSQYRKSSPDSRIYWRRIPEFSVETNEAELTSVTSKYKFTTRYSVSYLKDGPTDAVERALITDEGKVYSILPG